MIVTVTPNPSIDRTLRISALRRGEVVRARSASAEAGGKGLNVSRSLATHGLATVAVVPLNAASADVYIPLVGDTAQVEVVPISGDIRVNIGLVEPDGTVTKVNEPGPQLSAGELDALIERVAELASGATWVVGAGSLPPGTSDDFYARLARRLPAGTRFAVDAEGEALSASLGGGVALIKPNLRELEQLAGQTLITLGDVIGAARLVTRPGLSVLVSLGADGAVLVDNEGETHGEARIDDVANTVGAGDALLAGFLAAGANAAAVDSAVAWSVAACRSPGTQMRHVEAIDEAAVQVHHGASTARRLAA